MIGAREPSHRLAVLPKALLTLARRSPRESLGEAIRSIWIEIGRPNRLRERDSEKKFQQGESLVDVLALAIFVHQESVALASRCARAS
jgi:hypothetical protein